MILLLFSFILLKTQRKILKMKLNLLLLDAASALIFGLLWYAYPAKLLSKNTKNIQYDSIDIHMTQTFGLYLLYSGVISAYIYHIKNKEVANVIFLTKIFINLILLLSQIQISKQKDTQWDKNKHFSFGMTGLILSMVVSLAGYLVK